MQNKLQINSDALKEIAAIKDGKNIYFLREVEMSLKAIRKDTVPTSPLSIDRINRILAQPEHRPPNELSPQI